MAKYCCLASAETNCTESCSICAKEVCHEICSALVAAEITDKTKEELSSIIGQKEFELLCEYNHISYNDNKYSVIGGN